MNMVTHYYVVQIVCFFFFKQKTAYEMRISDWSSDVCSSDLKRCTTTTHVHANSTDAKVNTAFQHTLLSSSHVTELMIDCACVAKHNSWRRKCPSCNSCR